MVITLTFWVVQCVLCYALFSLTGFKRLIFRFNHVFHQRVMVNKLFTPFTTFVNIFNYSKKTTTRRDVMFIYNLSYDNWLMRRLSGVENGAKRLNRPWAKRPQGKTSSGWNVLLPFVQCLTHSNVKLCVRFFSIKQGPRASRPHYWQTWPGGPVA